MCLWSGFVGSMIIEGSFLRLVQKGRGGISKAGLAQVCYFWEIVCFLVDALVPVVFSQQSLHLKPNPQSQFDDSPQSQFHAQNNLHNRSHPQHHPSKAQNWKYAHHSTSKYFSLTHQKQSHISYSLSSKPYFYQYDQHFVYSCRFLIGLRSSLVCWWEFFRILGCGLWRFRCRLGELGFLGLGFVRIGCVRYAVFFFWFNCNELSYQEKNCDRQTKLYPHHWIYYNSQVSEVEVKFAVFVHWHAKQIYHSDEHEDAYILNIFADLDKIVDIKPDHEFIGYVVVIFFDFVEGRIDTGIILLVIIIIHCNLFTKQF